jgi:hypothetical protein
MNDGLGGFCFKVDVSTLGLSVAEMGQRRDCIDCAIKKDGFDIFKDLFVIPMLEGRLLMLGKLLHVVGRLAVLGEESDDAKLAPVPGRPILVGKPCRGSGKDCVRGTEFGRCSLLSTVPSRYLEFWIGGISVWRPTLQLLQEDSLSLENILLIIRIDDAVRPNANLLIYNCKRRRGSGFSWLMSIVIL